MEQPEEVLRLVRDLLTVRMQTLDEVMRWVDYLMKDVDNYSVELIYTKCPNRHLVLNILQSSIEFVRIKGVNDFEEFSRSFADKHSIKNGVVLWPVRIAISGKTVALPLYESLRVLGKEDVLVRLERALEKVRYVQEKEEEQGA